jgi:hypothetical protein
MFHSRYSVSLCCSVYCLCVNVYCTTALHRVATQLQLTNISYHIYIYMLLIKNQHIYNVCANCLFNKHFCIVCCFICFGLCLRTDTIEENCALRGYYTVSNGNFLRTFRDNPSVPSSRVKILKRKPGVPIWGL